MKRSRSFTTKPLPSISKAKAALNNKQISLEVQRNRVEQAIRETSKETGIPEDVVRDAVMTQLVGQQCPTLTAEDEKAQKILTNIQNSIPSEEQAQWLHDDNKIHNLMIDLNKAQKEKRFTSIAVINRQLEARGKEVLLEKAFELMQKHVVTGDIVKFMDADDAERFASARGKIFLCMDTLDSLLNDLTSTIRSCGMFGEVKMLESLVKARDEIQMWCDATTRHNDEVVKQLILDESDRVYEYICDRMPVLLRKCNRQLNKLEKESTN